MPIMPATPMASAAPRASHTRSRHGLHSSAQLVDPNVGGAVAKSRPC